jgi:hypothetical protein
MRGVVWDLRAHLAGTDPIVPLDLNASIAFDLNPGLINRKLVGWVGREMVYILVNGAHLKADIALHIVIAPHLVSLAVGVTSVAKEIERLRAKGWVMLFASMPFLSCRCIAQGSVSRKLEPDRMRRTSDGSGPHGDLEAHGGGAVISINKAIGMKTHLTDGVTPKWPAKEVKPRVQDPLLDWSILMHATKNVWHGPIAAATGDVSDYFNQLALRPSELWLSNFVWRGDDGTVGIASETQLGFGLVASSNIAQRFSDATLDIFRRRFDAEETALFDAETDPALAQRAALSAVT